MGGLRRAASVLASVLGSLLGPVTRYLKGVLGEDAYDKYLDHHSGAGCAGPAMSVKEFWRERMDRQDANPEGRCC